MSILSLKELQQDEEVARNAELRKHQTAPHIRDAMIADRKRAVKRGILIPTQPCRWWQWWRR